MIIAESLRDTSVLQSRRISIAERYDHLLDGEVPIEIVMIDVVEANLLPVMLDLSRSMLPKFYAHFVYGDTIYVVFTSTICAVKRGHAEDEEICLRLADVFGVHHAQLPFEKMFDFGHAEHESSLAPDLASKKRQHLTGSDLT